MSTQAKRPPAALKHGAYSEAVLLPGEDPAEFKKLHSGLIAEFRPNGRMEEETVASLARLIWRRQNLGRFEISQLASFIAEGIEKAHAKAKEANRKYRKYYKNTEENENCPYTKEEDKELLANFDKFVRSAQRARNAEGTSEEKRASLEAFEVGKATTLYRLMKELEVEERLDAMINKLLKQLLFIRGLKSVTSSAAMAHPVRNGLPRVPAGKRIAGNGDADSRH
jgi:hypothetical protein